MSKFIAVGHNHWGKASSIAEAVENTRKRMSRPSALTAGKPAFELFLVHDESSVNDWGAITYPDPNHDDANAPKSIGIFDWNGKALK